MSKNLPCLRNEQAISLKEIPVLKDIDFINELITGMSEGLRVITYFGDRINQTKVILYAVMADDRDGLLYPVSLPVNSGSFPSLAGRFPQVQLFEREIHEQTGLFRKDIHGSNQYGSLHHQFLTHSQCLQNLSAMRISSELKVRRFMKSQ